MKAFTTILLLVCIIGIGCNSVAKETFMYSNSKFFEANDGFNRNIGNKDSMLYYNGLSKAYNDICNHIYKKIK